MCPGVHLTLPFLSEADKQDLLFGIETGFDFVAASFVRTAEDVGEMRRFLEEHGGRRIKIISKIENAEGVENIDEILRFRTVSVAGAIWAWRSRWKMCRSIRSR